MNMFLRLLVVALRARRRGEATPLGPCHTPLRVRLGDLDPLGHMNNGVYFSIFDLGRVELMLRSGMYRQFKKHGWYAVVTAETGSFRRELRPFRRFDLETVIIGWDERHLYFQHRVFSEGRLTTSSVVQVRCLARSGERIDPDRLMRLMPATPTRPELPSWVSDWSKAAYEHSRASESTAAA